MKILIPQAQHTVLAGFDSFIRKRTYRTRREFDHRVPNGIEHFAHLLIASF